MSDDNLPCNFQHSTMVESTVPVSGIIRWKHWFLTKMESAKLRFMIFIRKIRNSIQSRFFTVESIDLFPGDWVEVKSFDEIAATLDRTGRNNGLYFMSSMKEYCGGRYKVVKVVKTIKLESTGELRKLKSPTVLLDTVFCKGRKEHCDRECYHFWREIWLRKVSPDITGTKASKQ